MHIFERSNNLLSSERKDDLEEKVTHVFVIVKQLETMKEILLTNSRHKVQKSVFVPSQPLSNFVTSIFNKKKVILVSKSSKIF